MSNSAKLRQLHDRLIEVAEQLAHTRFSPAGSSWRPAVNAYHCPRCIRVCVDLAGVENSRVQLQVEPRRLIIRGHRMLPEPREPEQRTLKVIALEIDCGPFEREIFFESEVETTNVHAEQQNGFLWIVLPLRSHS